MTVSLNGNLELVDALRQAGGKPQYATSWVGPWSSQASIDGHISACKSRGVLPAFHFFYWGDEICLEVLTGQATARELGTGAEETVGGYWALLKLLTARIKASGMQGVLVSIEGEWNKLGPKAPPGSRSVLVEPAVFDKLFADSAGYLHDNAPGTKVVTCPGSWSNLLTLLPQFPRMMQATDYVATQSLNTTFGQTMQLYVSSPDRLIQKVKDLRAVAGGKPVILLDTAWSSYAGQYEKTKPYTPVAPASPETNIRSGEGLQKAALERLGAILPDLEAAGLHALFYRGLKDAKMALSNYWGYFEWGWGVVRFDGSRKPAYDALMALGGPRTYTAAEYQSVVQRAEAAEAGWAKEREASAAFEATAKDLAARNERAQAALRGQQP